MKNKGQTLITLLFLMIVGIAVTSTATVVVLVNSKAANKLEQGEKSSLAAETGIENAILRLIRDSNYTGEIMTVENATITIDVVGDNPKIITSEGQTNDYKRKVQAQTEYNNNTWTVTSWKEIF